MSTPADSPSWLAAARTGCRDALGRALEGWRHYLLRIAHEELPANLQAKGSASDLVQEAFLEASHAFAQFRGVSEREFRAWLRQLLRRRIAKLGRRYCRTQKRRLVLEQSATSGSQIEKNAVPANVATPSAQVMEDEQAQALRGVLERLPEDYQRVIRLRYEEERSFEEIGVVMSRTANAARLLWLRAIERVKHELQAGYGC